MEGCGIWVKYVDDESGKPYYHNSHRGITAWELPEQNDNLLVIDRTTDECYRSDEPEKLNLVTLPQNLEVEDTQNTLNKKGRASITTTVQSDSQDSVDINSLMKETFAVIRIMEEESKAAEIQGDFESAAAKSRSIAHKLHQFIEKVKMLLDQNCDDWKMLESQWMQATMRAQSFDRLAITDQTRVQARPAETMVKNKMNAINELIVTEENYNKRMLLLQQHYLSPLEGELNCLKPVLTESELACVFGNITDVIHHSNALLQDLQSIKENDSTTIGKVMQSNMRYVSVYERYVLGFDKAFRLLQELQAKNSDFNAFLQKQKSEKLKSPSGNEETLHALDFYLIEPMQRILRYKLLLERILHDTNCKEEEELSRIKEALTLVSNIATTMNKKKAERESQENLRRIERLLELNGCTLPDGECSKQGSLKLISSSRKRKAGGDNTVKWCYLFENAFMCSEDTHSAQEQQGFFSNHFGGKQEIEQRKAAVRHGMVSSVVYPAAESDEDARRFEVSLGDEKLVWEAVSSGEALEWVYELRKALLHAAVGRGLSSGRSVEDVMKPWISSANKSLGLDEASKALRDLDQSLSEADSMQIATGMDRDKDGRISLEELSAALQHHQKQSRIRKPAPPNAAAGGKAVQKGAGGSALVPPTSTARRMVKCWSRTVMIVSIVLVAVAAIFPPLAPVVLGTVVVLAALTCCGISCCVMLGVMLAYGLALLIDARFQQAFGTSGGGLVELVPPFEGIDEVAGGSGSGGMSEDGSGRCQLVTILQFKKQWDRNGLLYYIGTNEGRKREWVNPVKKGLVTVTASSVGHNKPLSCIVARGSNKRGKCRFKTKSQLQPWVAVDFGRWRIVPSYYTLRHGGHADEAALSSWVLEGLEDGREELGFQVLKEHVDDSALTGEYKSASWPVETESAVGSTAGFRQLRIRVTSPHPTVLYIGGFEVYGRLLVMNGDADGPSEGDSEGDSDSEMDAETSSGLHSGAESDAGTADQQPGVQSDSTSAEGNMQQG